MKKIFAVLLPVMMLLGMLAVTAFADESADETMIPRSRSGSGGLGHAQSLGLGG